jgi:hypothetical protein
MPRFKLLVGQHIETNLDGREVTYKAGAEFDSVTDLDMMNAPGCPPKFQRLLEHYPVPQSHTHPSNPPRNAPVPGPKAQSSSRAPKARAGAPHSQGAIPVVPVAGSPPSVSGTNDGLDTLTVSELQKVAQEEEIELKGANSKEEILAAIRAAM